MLAELVGEQPRVAVLALDGADPDAAEEECHRRLGSHQTHDVQIRDPIWSEQVEAFGLHHVSVSKLPSWFGAFRTLPDLKAAGIEFDPAPTEAALNRFVCVMVHEVMKPP